MAMRALIVDDEAHARTRLKQMLRSEPDVQIIGECSNGRQAMEAIRADNPDLLFLDVQMPGLTGLNVCEALTNAGLRTPLIIFVTAYDEFAVKAFELHATD